MSDFNLSNCEEDQSPFPREVDNFVVYALGFKNKKNKQKVIELMQDVWNTLSKDSNGLIYRRLPELSEERELFFFNKRSNLSFRIAPRNGQEFSKVFNNFIKPECEPIKYYEDMLNA